MKGKWLRSALFIGLVLMLAACAGQKGAAPKVDATTQQVQHDDDQVQSEDSSMDTEDHEEGSENADAAPEDNTDEESPPDSPEVDVAGIYDEFCAGCRGDNRQGKSGPPLLPENLPLDASEYAKIITEGKGTRMPAWKDAFNDEVIQSLAEWLKIPVE